MSQRPMHRRWLVFAGCVLLVIAAMSGVTWLVLHMEHENRENQAVARKQEALRLALWRMDAWMAPRIGREAGRPWFEYEPYYSSTITYTRMLNPVQYGDVLTPSILLTFESPYFPLHFQIDSAGTVTSPQVPTGNLRDLAEATLLENGWVERKKQSLELVRLLVGANDVQAACRTIEARFRSIAHDEHEQDSVMYSYEEADDSLVDSKSKRIDKQNWIELKQRAAQTMNLQQEATSPPQPPSQQVQIDKPVAGYVDQLQSESAALNAGTLVEAKVETEQAMADSSGMLVPLWVDDVDGQGSELMFIRRVQVAGDERFQGVLVDFETLRDELLQQASDLLPSLSIQPQPASYPPSESESAWALSTLPAVVQSDALPAIEQGWLTPARLTILLMWLGVATAIVATAMTLRSTIDFANRRNRFASAVTHELRTPLTTFQMYSEMLAAGMVNDPEKMQVYHDTLREESTRLGTIVENVLAYSQIEDGHADSRREVITMTSLMQRLLAAIEPRIEKSSCDMVMESECQHADDDAALAELRVNVDAISTIVLNLVDNACKYGCREESSDASHAANVVTIRLVLLQDRTTLRCEVCDNGPGVDDDVARRIFEPFERGHIPPGSPKPGVGIGLALARDLAKTMGGTLTLRRNNKDETGACFVLEVDAA